MVTAGILPFRKNSHDRAWNRTRDLMISSQRFWPLDHEAGRLQTCNMIEFPDLRRVEFEAFWDVAQRLLVNGSPR